MTTTEKTCFKCGLLKPIADFYKHSMMADGHLNKCKECTKIDVRANRIKRIDHYKEFDRKRAMVDSRVAARKAYQSTPNGKAAIARSLVRYRLRFPERAAAHAALGNAIRDRKVIKAEACWYCGSTESIQGHHADYDAPLAVTWLCSKCHREAHKITKMFLAGIRVEPEPSEENY